MKRFKLILMTTLTIIAFTACRKSTRIIESHSFHDFIKIEYSGNVYFNKEQTAITNISPGGFVKYESNDKQLEARKDASGRIIYILHAGGRQESTDDIEGRDLIASAVKDMALRGQNVEE